VGLDSAALSVVPRFELLAPLQLAGLVAAIIRFMATGSHRTAETGS
jgi:hypothetical protein